MAAPGREDLFLSLEERISLAESVDARIDPSSETSKSKSSVEYAGAFTLYSPNAATRLTDGSYYIADTDNHRIVQVSADGLLLAEILGFNNPTSVAFLSGTQ